MVATAIAKFRDGIDDFIRSENVSFKEYVEASLRISQKDNYNLSVLKYYVEEDDGVDRDIALKFINTLQDCYDGRNVDIGAVNNLQDLYIGKESVYMNKNVMDMLLANSGISVGTLNEAWIEENNVVQVTSSVVRNRDGSFTGKVTSYEDLVSFKNILHTKYNYYLTAERSLDVENKVSSLGDVDFGENSVVCFANLTGQEAKYTAFNTEYSVEFDKAKPFSSIVECEYKGALFELWVL